jgi:hypothetical protein
MRTVRGPNGDRYVRLKESGDSSLVRNAETGETTHLPNDDLEPVSGESPLDALAAAIPEDARRVARACHDDWLFGLLVDLADRGPLTAREMLGAYDTCESDFVGGINELRAAGLVEETTVHGERGYELTQTGQSGLEALRA